MSRGNEDALPFTDDRVKTRLEIIKQLYEQDRIEEREARKFTTQITYWAIIAIFGIPTVMKSGQIPTISVVLFFYVIAWYLFGFKGLTEIHWCKMLRESYWKGDCAKLRAPNAFDPMKSTAEYRKSENVTLIKRFLPHADFNITLLVVVFIAYAVASIFVVP